MNSLPKKNKEENLDKKEEQKIEKNNKNIYINKKANKFSSFNNIQISSNNNNNNLKNGNVYTYILTNKKEIQNLQISNINSDNNKYSNNNSHQGICFIANNPKEKSQNKFINSKISSSQGISYIVPNNKKYKDDNLSNKYSESHHNEFTYIAQEKPINNVSSNFKNSQLNTTSQGVSYIAQGPINQINGISYISQNNNINSTKKFEKENNNYQLSSQNNTFAYIAPEQNKSSKLKCNFNKNNFEISSNKNNYFYIAKDKYEKKEVNKKNLDNFKFNHNESMTFICEDKKIDNNKYFVLTKCEGDNFKYIKDDATGAQILNE